MLKFSKRSLSGLINIFQNIISQMEEADKVEPYAPTAEQVKAAIQELTKRKEKYQGYHFYQKIRYRFSGTNVENP